MNIEQNTTPLNSITNFEDSLSEVNPELATPLYIQIREHFQSGIQAEHYPVHTRLPSERQLAERFKVSRMTVTKALKELEQQGLVYTQTGKGTFVASRQKIDQTLETLTSFTEDMADQGKKVTSRVIKMGIEQAEEFEANKLKVSPGTRLFVLERFRLADDEIISLECTFIPYALCPDIDKNYDFTKESLYKILRQKYFFNLSFAQQTVEARRPTEEETEKLQIDTTDPVLSFTRTTLNPLSKPVEFVKSVYLGDRYKLRIMLKPSAQNILAQELE
jgi:GntR family transcriptional regulator